MSGIVNGTTNFILTAMANEGRSYDGALAEAQRLGYAETDPADDVSGRDARSRHRSSPASPLVSGLRRGKWIVRVSKR